MGYLHNLLKEKNDRGLFIGISLLIIYLLVTQIFKIDYFETDVQAAPPLLQRSDLVYQGSFRVSSTFSYGGDILAWNPVRGTLLLGGNNFGEVSVPALKTGAVTTLNTATTVTAPFDPFEGKRNQVKAGTPEQTIMGGLWVEGNKLYMDSWIYYDANHNQNTSHFVRPLDFASRGQVQGPFATTAQKQAWVSGYFAAVPPEWQARLGGRVMNGLCCVAIISRTSSGASAWVIDPAQIGVVNPIPVTPLVYYPINHLIDPPRGGWRGDNTYYNGAGSMGSAIWPGGTDSILFFGSTGLGEFCYGGGTTNPALHKMPVGNSTVDIYCYDPTNPYKGVHAYPYVSRIWAYDANDFLAVKNGAKQPWDLLPYTYWDITFPVAHPQSPAAVQGFKGMGGVTYDPATGRIFVAQIKADTPQSYNFPPVIHVYTIGSGGTPVPTPTPTPTSTPTPMSSSITCNGVSNICNVINGDKASIGWACSGGATSGQVRNDQDAVIWSGLSGLHDTDDLTKDTMYFIECSGAGNTNVGNVFINVVQRPITDITSPQVIIFNVSRSSSGLVTLSWDVSDSGGSFLNRVVLERSISDPTDCNSTTQTGCNWTFVSNVSAPIDFNRWDSAIYDPSSIGNSYEYRIKVFDNAGNMTVYPVPLPPIKHPTLAVNLSTVRPGDPITVFWSNLDSVAPNPTATDWIGLYPPGVNDFGYLSYIYAGSCTSIVGAVPNVFGSCSFIIPASTPAGTYNLQLFADIPRANGLARTAYFTVITTPSPSSAPTPTGTATPTTTPAPSPSISSGPTPTASALPPPPGPQSFDFLFEIPNPFSGQISTFDDLINAIIIFLYYIAGPIIVVMIVLAGLFFLFGRGEPSKIETGKKILFYAIIGLIIILIGRGFITLLYSILELGT